MKNSSSVYHTIPQSYHSSGHKAQRNNGLTQKPVVLQLIIKDDLAAGFDFTPPGTGLGNQLANARMVGYLSKGKRYSKALLPERKKELDELINRLDEEDNPVMVVVTLK